MVDVMRKRVRRGILDPARPEDSERTGSAPPLQQSGQTAATKADRSADLKFARSTSSSPQDYVLQEVNKYRLA